MLDTLERVEARERVAETERYKGLDHTDTERSFNDTFTCLLMVPVIVFLVSLLNFTMVDGIVTAVGVAAAYAVVRILSIGRGFTQIGHLNRDKIIVPDSIVVGFSGAMIAASFGADVVIQAAVAAFAALPFYIHSRATAKD